MFLNSKEVIQRRIDAETVFFGLTFGVFIIALIFGGGTTQGLASDAVVELVCLPLLGWSILRLASEQNCRHARVPVALLAAMLTLLLVQLVPLPPALWTLLPGRSKIVETYELIGYRLPWWPVSLQPEATLRAFLSALPAAALFLAMLTLDTRRRRVLSLGFAVFAGVSVVIGLAQIAQGEDSIFRFYEFTNRGSSVGFFSNRNHYATLLCSAIPFALIWAAHFVEGRGTASRVAFIACSLLSVLLILGTAMSFSRAGILLAITAYGASLFLLLLGRQQSSKLHGKRLLVGTGLVALVLIGHYALAGLISTFVSKMDAIVRPQIWEVSGTAAASLLPLGAGFGTFQTVYGWYDLPEALLAGAYVNRAHNDWLEVVLEGGLPVVLLIGLFLIWFVRCASRAWRGHLPGKSHHQVRLERGASISILIILLHSFVDYPLRTLAIQAVFAFCCAVLVRPLIEQAPTEDGWRRRKSRRSGPPSGGSNNKIRSPRKPSASPRPTRPPQFRPSTTWTD